MLTQEVIDNRFALVREYKSLKQGDKQRWREEHHITESLIKRYWNMMQGKIPVPKVAQARPIDIDRTPLRAIGLTHRLRTLYTRWGYGNKEDFYVSTPATFYHGRPTEETLIALAEKAVEEYGKRGIVAVRERLIGKIDKAWK